MVESWSGRSRETTSGNNKKAGSPDWQQLEVDLCKPFPFYDADSEFYQPLRVIQRAISLDDTEMEHRKHPLFILI